MKYVLTIVLVFVGQSVQAQELGIDWDFWRSSIEKRLEVIETRLEITNNTPTKSTNDSVLRYQAAVATALAKNLPLVVWSGTAICPPCVTQTQEEFSNYVGTVANTKRDAVVVYMPEGGQLKLAGVVDSWVTGDPYYGHVPSVRRLVDRWRSQRLQVKANKVSQPTYSRQATTYQYTQGYQASPAMYYASQQSMLGSSGGCASCGTAGGIFRFRR